MHDVDSKNETIMQRSDEWAADTVGLKRTSSGGLVADTYSGRRAIAHAKESQLDAAAMFDNEENKALADSDVGLLQPTLDGVVVSGVDRPPEVS